MKTKRGIASVDQVIRTYQGDSKVEELSSVWPDTPAERVALVRRACRPVDAILGLAWELWEYDEDDFRSEVFAVWSRSAGDPIHSWTFGEMFDHIDANPSWVPQPFDPKKWAAVRTWRPRMKANPPTSIGPLIAFQGPACQVLLDDGHTRLMAAHLEKVVPKQLLLFVGISPVV